MRKTRVLVRGLTPLRPCRARSTVPIEVPRASAMSRMPAALAPLSLGPMIDIPLSFAQPSNPKAAKSNFDSSIGACSSPARAGAFYGTVAEPLGYAEGEQQSAEGKAHESDDKRE